MVTHIMLAYQLICEHDMGHHLSGHALEAGNVFYLLTMVTWCHDSAIEIVNKESFVQFTTDTGRDKTACKTLTLEIYK